MGLVRDQRRGLASSLNALSRHLPSVFGPLVGGWVLGMRMFVLPFAIAAAMRGAYVVLLPRVMGPYLDVPGNQERIRTPRVNPRLIQSSGQLEIENDQPSTTADECLGYPSVLDHG